ncbi:PPOX class F420-dependent oxidoreductase [Phycicoccus sp. HDW14]|uniref:PPOX class F420-dependent oxidoreductase n=1 Tax=Phycicoccus sp. HDW14 TaxID=2714941 RepID=UPI001409C25B|nr:PPOX class F420-dependent oxidoreductase [Phycicoccus sp. HDW14]QIM22516.1 PPOX class F420-dependent oxidoreductase [Phycicoccus sp. HDW14]
MTAADHPLAAAKYARLTTFRRTGAPVSSPVWVAPAVDGTDHLVVITVDATGKTKRLAHTRRVELQPCDVRGRVAEGAPTYRGEGVVVREPDEVAAVRAAVVAKYGLPARLSDLLDRFTGRTALGRKARAGIVLTVERDPVA